MKKVWWINYENYMEFVVYRISARTDLQQAYKVEYILISTANWQNNLNLHSKWLYFNVVLTKLESFLPY